MSAFDFSSNIEAIQEAFPSLVEIKVAKRGGQKDVYTAESAVYGSIVLKLMTLDAKGLPPRIEREIQIVSKGGFPGVPKMYEHGLVDIAAFKACYIIEQRISGEDVRAKLVREGKQNKDFVVKMLESLLKTITAMWNSGIVHRDIKPDNIMVDADGNFWLLDFGIARDVGDVSLTLTDAKMGPLSPGYAPPEQVMNYKHLIDDRTDLFALGVTAYELLSGKHPFAGSAHNAIEAVITSVTVKEETLEIPGDNNGELATLIKTMMNKQQTLRPTSASMALDWLMSII